MTRSTIALLPRTGASRLTQAANRTSGVISNLGLPFRIAAIIWLAAFSGEMAFSSYQSAMRCSSTGSSPRAVLMMLVATLPGYTTVRPTVVSWSSSRSDSEKPRTANLVVQ